MSEGGQNRSPVEESEMTQLLREWLKKSGMNLEQVEERDEGCMRWRFSAMDGMGVYFTLVEMESEDFTQINLEVYLTFLEPRQHGPIMEWLLKNAYDNFMPFKLCLDERNALVMRFSDLVEPHDPEYIIFLAREIINESNELLRSLSVKFALRPYQEIISAKRMAS
jgi:hypothetical protein